MIPVGVPEKFRNGNTPAAMISAVQMTSARVERFQLSDVTAVIAALEVRIYGVGCTR